MARRKRTDKGNLYYCVRIKNSCVTSFFINVDIALKMVWHVNRIA